MRKYLLIALMIGVVSVFGFGGCSLLNTTSVQCLSEAECLAKGPAFANTTCDSVSKTCMQVDAGARSCQHNSDCIAANNNAAAICRKSDYKCAVLQTAECPDFLGTLDQLKNDNAIVLGMLSGFPTDLISLQYERAVTMAQQDFTTSSGVMGLPSFDGSGNVYVSDFYSNSWVKFSPSGKLLMAVSTDIAQPEGIAVDQQGNVYVANSTTNAITVYNAQGTLINTLK